MKKIVAVVGSTGAQGGGLAHAILADKEAGFTVRAITRKADGEKARALAKLGAEVVSADLDDEASLRRAFAGAHAAYCVTNFWEHMSAEKELAQAKALANAVKEAGVSHVIWSTLDDTRKLVPLSDDRMPTLGGKYKVPHFDAKGEADEFFRKSGVPYTLLLTSFYWDNLIHFGMGPKKNQEGKLAIVFPMGDKKLPGIASEDIGKCAYGILKRGTELTGKTVGIAGEMLTGQEMATALGRALEKEVVYTDVPPSVYRGFGFPGADDLGNMFQYKRDFNAQFCGARDVGLAKALNPELQSFAMWLKRNKSSIPLG